MIIKKYTPKSKHLFSNNASISKTFGEAEARRSISFPTKMDRRATLNRTSSTRSGELRKKETLKGLFSMHRSASTRSIYGSNGPRNSSQMPNRSSAAARFTTEPDDVDESGYGYIDGFDRLADSFQSDLDFFEFEENG